jgi:hypothetical protein
MIRVIVQPEQLEGESGSEVGTTAAGETSDRKIRSKLSYGRSVQPDV